MALLGCCVLGTSGCYLAHVAAGQVRLLRASRPIETVLADPSTTPDVRERLLLAGRARAFAIDLGLEVGGQYTSYVPWPGDRLVTSVVATRPGEVEPAGFWFPILGRLPYKGFFDSERAAREAARLRARGWDVCEVGVRAYSTLGWLDDPLTGPLIRGDEGWLVETIVHELVHATVFRRGHPDFNEGVASFIGEEAAVAFYAESGEPGRAAAERQRVADRRRLRAALLGLRRRVEELYTTMPAGDARAAARLGLEMRAREEIAGLPMAAREGRELAGRLRLNDACLALAATYASDTHLYGQRLAALGGDLRRFVLRLRDAEDADDPRAALLGP